MSVLLWFLQSFDFTMHFTVDSESSMLGVIGSFLAPVFKPAGFGTWQAAVSLLTGFVAKEAVVSSMCLFYGISSTAGAEAAGNLGRNVWNAGRGVCISHFYTAVHTVRRCLCNDETGTRRLEMGARRAAYQIGIAYVMSVLAYRIGLLIL